MNGRTGHTTGRRHTRRVVLLVAALLGVLLLPASASAAGLGCADDASGTEDRSSFNADILAATNAHRAGLGLPALQLDPLLSKASLWKARDLGRRNYFSHDDPISGGGARTPWQRLIDCGYDVPNSSRAENIAAGQSSGAAFTQAWINSPGHRANIENAAFLYIGIGTANVPGSTYGNYSVQMFSSKSSGQPPLVAPAAPTMTAATLVADGSFVDVCPPAGSSGTTYEAESAPSGVAVNVSKSVAGCMRITAPVGIAPGIGAISYRATSSGGTSAAVMLRLTVEAPRTLTGVDPAPGTVTAGSTTSLRGSSARITSRTCRGRGSVAGRCWTLTITALLRTATGQPIAGQRVAFSRVDATGKRQGIGAAATNARGVAIHSRAIRPPAKGTSAWLKRMWSSSRLHYAGTNTYAPTVATAKFRIR